MKNISKRFINILLFTLITSTIVKTISYFNYEYLVLINKSQRVLSITRNFETEDENKFIVDKKIELPSGKKAYFHDNPRKLKIFLGNETYYDLSMTANQRNVLNIQGKFHGPDSNNWSVEIVKDTKNKRKDCPDENPDQCVTSIPVNLILYEKQQPS